MRTAIFLSPLILVLWFTSACQKQSGGLTKEPMVNFEADVVSINTLLEKWVNLYNAGEFSRLVDLFYMDHAILIAPDVSIREG